MDAHNEMLERVIALDVEDLRREIAFAEAADVPGPGAEKWLAILREELAERELVK